MTNSVHDADRITVTQISTRDNPDGETSSAAGEPAVTTSHVKLPPIPQTSTRSKFWRYVNHPLVQAQIALLERLDFETDYEGDIEDYLVDDDDDDTMGDSSTRHPSPSFSRSRLPYKVRDKSLRERLTRLREHWREPLPADAEEKPAEVETAGREAHGEKAETVTEEVEIVVDSDATILADDPEEHTPVKVVKAEAAETGRNTVEIAPLSDSNCSGITDIGVSEDEQTVELDDKVRKVFHQDLDEMQREIMTSANQEVLIETIDRLNAAVEEAGDADDSVWVSDDETVVGDSDMSWQDQGAGHNLSSGSTNKEISIHVAPRVPHYLHASGLSLTKFSILHCSASTVRKWFGRGWHDGAKANFDGVWGPGDNVPKALEDIQDRLRQDLKVFIYVTGYTMGQAFVCDTKELAKAGYESYYDEEFHKEIVQVSAFYLEVHRFTGASVPPRRTSRVINLPMTF